MQQIQNRKKQPPVLPQSLQRILPAGVADAVYECGAERIEELRLHAGRLSFVTCSRKNYPLRILLSGKELSDLLRALCGDSLYAHAHTINQGYVRFSDGIRVGVAGSVALEKGEVLGVSSFSSLIIRIPHEVRPDISLLEERFLRRGIPQGTLILSPPGVGKTTILRGLAKAAASAPYFLRTAVVDTREELCFGLEDERMNLDLLSGYPRQTGISIALCSLNPQLIVCDEISSPEDAQAILDAAGCGVPVLASAHAASAEELISRPVFRQLYRARVFLLWVSVCRDAADHFHFQFTEADESAE